MKPIVSSFNKFAAKKYGDFGFVRGKHGFIRLNNDILQVFECIRTRQVSTCTVCFGTIPLCAGNTVFGSGLYELHILDPAYLNHTNGWQFNPFSASSVTSCVELMLQAFDRYLIPFFQNCNDCQSTLGEMIKLDELMDRRRIEALALWGGTDRAVPWQERSILDPLKYYMALKSKNMEYAKNFLTIHIRLCNSERKSWESPGSPQQPEIVKKRYIEMHTRYTEHLERLLDNDTEFFEALLKQNEEQTLIAIAQQFPGLRDCV